MAYELYYTSAPRGLRATGSGYCTVAETRGLPGPLAAKLEQLGGLRPSVQSGANKGGGVALLAHYRLTVGGSTRSVLTRVAPAGSDHTGRANALAYHLSLDPAELPAAGPVWAAGQLSAVAWEGEPRLLDPPARPAGPQTTTPPAPQPCDRWAAAAGDAGWGGVLAESTLSAAGRPAYLIVPPDLDPLPLLAEAAALVSPALLWHVTFSTRYAGGPPPAGAECRWRCVADGSPAAEEVRRRSVAAAVVVDLARPSPPPPGPAADRGRAGQIVEVPDD